MERVRERARRGPRGATPQGPVSAPMTATWATPAQRADRRAEESTQAPRPEGAGAWLTPAIMMRALAMADIVAVCIGLGIAVLAQEVLRPGVVVGTVHARLAAVSLPVWMLVLVLNGLYKSRAIHRQTDEFRRILNSSAIAVGLTVLLAFSIQMKDLSRLWMLSVLVIVPACLVVNRVIARRITEWLYRTGQMTRRVLIVGTDADAVGVLHSMTRQKELGYHVVGFVGPDDIGVREGCSVLGGFDDVRQVLEDTGASHVVISLGSVDGDRVNRLTRGLTDAGYCVSLSMGLRDIDVARFSTQDAGGRTLVFVDRVIRGGWRARAKRAFDITVALTGLLCSLPVLVVAAIAIKLDSNGPLLFSQPRVGQDGRTFRIHKLRTMSTDAEARKAGLIDQNEADGPLFKMANDPRVTRPGRFLRKFSIDEIPQFLNVLKGEMSIVGPRPATPDEVEQWDDELRDRLRVPPGITGLWQVSGRSDSSFEQYKRYDLYYVDNWCLAHDLRIVARTFGVVVGARGAR